MRDVRGLDIFNYQLSPEETIIREKAFKCILEGIPATPHYLYQITGMPHEQIKFTVDKLAQSGMLVVDSESGNVVGSHGLSLVETPHRLHIKGNDLFTWCAIDAVGIPSALKVDAQINSTCFICQKKLIIELIKGQIVDSSEPNIQLWLVEADIGRSLVGCT